MANEYPKEVQVAFEDMLEGFDKETVLAQKAAKKKPDPKEMHRKNDVMWRPQPMIETTVEGLDTTGLTNDLSQLVVPATLSHIDTVFWDLDSLQLRDDNYMKEQTKAAMQAMAAKVETRLARVAATTGGQVITVNGAMSGYDDLSLAEVALDEIGVGSGGRSFFVNSRDKRNIGSDLAARQTIGNKSASAMEKSFIGDFANFEVYTSSNMPRIAGSSVTGVTVSGDNQGHVVSASRELATGEVQNNDNRYQTLVVSDTTGIAAGDSFVIDGVDKVQLISKEPTAQPFTNRVIEVVNGTTLLVLAMIPDGKYQNVEIEPVDGADITFMNIASAQSNVFWKDGSIELLGGNLAIEDMTDLSPQFGTTEGSGIQIAMMKQANIDTVTQRYKFSIFYGTANLNPQMNGILLANQ